MHHKCRRDETSEMLALKTPALGISDMPYMVDQWQSRLRDLEQISQLENARQTETTGAT